jgi:hypothetical protein
MKTVLFLLLLVLSVSFTAVDTEPFSLTLPLILALVAGIYEVVIRLIPTVGQYALIGKIIDILKWLSDFLNRKKR